MTGEPTEGFRPEIESEWTAERTVEFVKERWQGFFHNHPQETVRDPKTPDLTVDVVELFTETLGMKYHATLQHLEKAYPEEKVVSVERVQAEAQRVSQETGRPVEELMPEVFERLRQLEFHAPSDVEQWAMQVRELGGEQRNTLGGAEVDVAMDLDADGRPTFRTYTSAEKLESIDLDYLVFSLHPDIDPALKKISVVDGDPEKLTQAYEAMAKLASDIRQKNPNHPLVLAGHPLSRAEGRKNLSREQKERIVDAFTSRGIPMEIALNDYYWSKPDPVKTPEEVMAEKVPLLDPEFLELIKDKGTTIFVDTDLHLGGWLADKGWEAQTKPTKIGRREGDTRDFTAATVAEDLEDIWQRPLMNLPKYFRPQAARFVRAVRHLLQSGINPDQILNTKSLDEMHAHQASMDH